MCGLEPKSAQDLDIARIDLKKTSFILVMPFKHFSSSCGLAAREPFICLMMWHVLTNEETRLKPKFYDNLRFRVKKKSTKSRRPFNWCLKITHGLRVLRLDNNEKSSNSLGAMKGFNTMY
jgi:hypothetical protein